VSPRCDTPSKVIPCKSITDYNGEIANTDYRILCVGRCADIRFLGRLNGGIDSPVKGGPTPTPETTARLYCVAWSTLHRCSMPLTGKAIHDGLGALLCASSRQLPVVSRYCDNTAEHSMSRASSTRTHTCNITPTSALWKQHLITGLKISFNIPRFQSFVLCILETDL
jgi:hypothetical protein